MSKSADLEDIRQSSLDYAQAAISKGREAIENDMPLNFNPIEQANGALDLFERVSR
ncbi:MAG: hypothetical protein ABF709_01280 [Leuconostoc pseudomesenteroides]|uniref:hypothetical protein n=1 Tax=Leuconostoc pseudomesenteroides TaxID=33968 RepID=UPI0039E92C4E